MHSPNIIPMGTVVILDEAHSIGRRAAPVGTRATARGDLRHLSSGEYSGLLDFGPTILTERYGDNHAWDADYRLHIASPEELEQEPERGINNMLILAGTEVVATEIFRGPRGEIQVGTVGIATTDLSETAPGIFEGAVRYPRSGIGRSSDPDLLVGTHYLRPAQEGERTRLPDGYFWDQAGRVRHSQNHQPRG